MIPNLLQLLWRGALGSAPLLLRGIDMTDEDFAQLTQDYIAATEARLALIRADIPATPEARAVYREVAERESKLAQAWEAEMNRPATD